MAYRILLVEDTGDIRTLMRVVLESYGYSVIEATDGVEAVEKAGSELPDAIIIDMSLPLLDGSKATRLIRENPALRHVPIIACTAYNRWEWRGKSLVAGCDAFITKPVDFDQLHATLSALLSRRKAS
ncbi:MAG: response regulator [Acidobacteria bacterium]|nr:response regulator [Acidobacteriota bacterium]